VTSLSSFYAPFTHTHTHSLSLSLSSETPRPYLHYISESASASAKCQCQCKCAPATSTRSTAGASRPRVPSPCQPDAGRGSKQGINDSTTTLARLATRGQTMSNSPSDTINARVKPELDMDTFFDFNQSTTQASPMIGSSADAMSSFGDSKERQQYNGPSHAYDQYKQQVGLPMGSVANLAPMSQQQSLEGFNSGVAGDMAFDSGFGAGWSSGIDIDSDMAMDFGNPASAMPAMFFPSPAANDAAANDSFINPNNIQEEHASTVRLWPGVHSQRAQQAAMQKALQVQAAQQRQMKLQAQQAHYQRHASNASQSQVPPQPTPTSTSKRASHAAPTDPHVEESISRLLSQMRQQSNASADEDGLDMLPHIARLKKDEEEMDEDERLLNSEEGKKLSSKERRQLRNKVSARAFRSRRKGKCPSSLPKYALPILTYL